MARVVLPQIQQNLWGASRGLDAQRVDLWYVDMDAAVKRLQAVTGVQLSPIFPQFVQSVALPEIKMRAVAIRRDSIPYQMPSWDEPLDAVKIVFIMDTTGNVNESAVGKLLDTWTTLVRGGRGSRKTGYFSPNNAPTLDNTFSLDFRFDFKVSLLRGSAVSSSLPTQSALNSQLALINRANAQVQQAQSQLQRNSIPSGLSQRPNVPTGVGGGSSSVFSALEVAAEYQLTRAWLASYRVNELSYASSNTLTIDAMFYVESVDAESATGSRVVAVNNAP